MSTTQTWRPSGWNWDSLKKVPGGFVYKRFGSTKASVFWYARTDSGRTLGPFTTRKAAVGAIAPEVTPS